MLFRIQASTEQMYALSSTSSIHREVRLENKEYNLSLLLVCTDRRQGNIHRIVKIKCSSLFIESSVDKQ
jgi:hypothetical protein